MPVRGTVLSSCHPFFGLTDSLALSEKAVPVFLKLEHEKDFRSLLMTEKKDIKLKSSGTCNLLY